MSQNAPEWQWTKGKERAAVLVAEDELTDAEIGEAVHVVRQTITRWKAAPAFAARVGEIRAALGATCLRHAIAKRNRRVREMEDRYERMRQVIAERAADPTRAGVPGGSSGLLVRSVKVVGAGDVAREVEEWTLDAALLREIRELEKQAAQELGQWTEQHSMTAEVTQRQYVGVDVEKAV